MFASSFLRVAATSVLLLFCTTPCSAAELRVLFLGDNGHHIPAARYAQLQPVFATRGIELIYTDAVNDLNPEKLANYDALLLYANIDEIAPAQEQALLNYVAGGGGFVPIHCATYCFRNAPAIVDLMGAQFERHSTGVFRSEIAEPDHPVMRGFHGFESWDETYVHHRHNERNRVVLSYRVDEQGREPWTWVRNQGRGRVFYTAWGHDERTWGHPGFQNLLERGIRWAAGKDPAVAGPYGAERAFSSPKMTPQRKDVAAFEYTDVGAKIPNYIPSDKWGAQGEPKRTMQLPLSPEESLKHFVTPEGFHVELFAAEPDLGGKPIAMTWDERGRLFVCETFDYPNELQPPGQGRDRIRICTDTDQDGVADTFTVFAEDLSVPTAITPYRGGMIVQSGTETLFLKDLDGDDRADQREVLIENWNVRDTHGGVSNFRYGLDNWIWGMQGYNPSQPVIDGRQQQAFRMGFFRFRLDNSDPPRVTDFEFIRSTDNNTWGLGLSEEGLVFGSTANHNPSVFMPIPNRYYEQVRGWTRSLVLSSIADTHLFKPITENVRQVDHFGGYTAGAGHALYTARRYPAEYWNRTAFVNGPTGHLIGTFVLTPQGSDFRSTSTFNLLASDDEWSAPILAEVGPDGNVWVIDWYNYIVQHNPTPQGFETGKGQAYETDLRDKKHGRIYRVVYLSDDAPPALQLTDATPERLIEFLSHPTMLCRQQAQRLLVEQQATSVLPQLIELVTDTSVDEIGLNVGAMHALWTIHGLGLLEGTNEQASRAVLAALRHPSAGVRRAALQVLPQTTDSTKAVIKAGLCFDLEPQVRLAALLALADLPAVPEAGQHIVDATRLPQNSGDRWIPDAATCAAANHSEPFLKALAATGPMSEPLSDMATVVSEHYARGAPVNGVLALCEKLVEAEPAMSGAVIRGLTAGWPEDRELEDSARIEPIVAQLLPRLAVPDRGLLIQLATRWGSDSLQEYVANVRASLLEQLDNPEISHEHRVTAARQFVAFDPEDAEAITTILNRITPQTPPELATELLRSLQASESSELGSQLVDHLLQLTPATRPAAVAVLLTRPASTMALLEGINDGVIRLSELSPDQRQMLMDHPDAAVRMTGRAVLSRGGALPSADRQQVIDDLLPEVVQRGNAAQGKQIFKKHCAKCHQHSGEGEHIGPDLTGMAVHPKQELLTHILDPNRSVEGNFQIYTVVTSDGRVLSGILTSETQTTVELLDAEGKRTTILREDIDELAPSTKSLMPEGIEKLATAAELRDLLEFLTQRGRFLPLDIAKAATIASDRGMFNSTEASVERLIFDDWSPHTFAGVPFTLIDPANGTTPNVIMLHSSNGNVCRTMPKVAQLPCNGVVQTIHMLSGVSGWGYPASSENSVSLIVRLHYADGQQEDHPLLNREHFADYIRRVDVPGSEFAFALRDQQVRYLAILPQRTEPIERIEFIKGPDRTAPVIMAVTLETPTSETEPQ